MTSKPLQLAGLHGAAIALYAGNVYLAVQYLIGNARAVSLTEITSGWFVAIWVAAQLLFTTTALIGSWATSKATSVSEMRWAQNTEITGCIIGLVVCSSIYRYSLEAGQVSAVTTKAFAEIFIAAGVLRSAQILWEKRQITLSTRDPKPADQTLAEPDHPGR